MSEYEHEFILEAENELHLEANERSELIPLADIFEAYEGERKDALEVADELGITETDVRRANLYWTTNQENYARVVAESNLDFKQAFYEKDSGNQDLNSVEGWDHLMRNSLGDLVLKDEEGTTANSTSTMSADIFFTGFYEAGLTPAEISQKSSVGVEEVEEVIAYAQESVENIHELGRKSYEMKQIIEEQTDRGVEDIEEITVENAEGSKEYLDYPGTLGTLQDFIEKQVEKRGFNVKHNPQESEQYRSSTEMHVLPEEGSEHELYLGHDGEELFLGSTISDADKSIRDVDAENTENMIKQELNSLAFTL